MVDKHRLPRIRGQENSNDPLARNIGHVDAEVQRLKLNFNTYQEKQENRWSSSKFVRYKGRSSIKKNARRKRSESLIRPEEVLQRQGQERINNATLKRYNSEPFLQQTWGEFSVQATSLRLNNRNKDGNKKMSRGFLPPVFFDPKISSDNPAVDLAKIDSELAKIDSDKTKKMIPDFQNNRKMLNKNEIKEKEKQSRNSNRSRKSESHADKSFGELGEINRKTKGLLPKRRLSEQIDSYEVSRSTNDKAFPRRITIRTSKSCPTIVIQECGDNDDSSETWKNTKNELDIVNKEICIGENDLTVLRSRTTSLVASWKPKQSFVHEK